MKKTRFFEFFFIFVSLFLYVIFGCKFSVDTKNLYKAPSVRIQEETNIVTLSISKKTKSIQYVNVYRVDVTKSDKITEDAVENIGMFYPKYMDDTTDSFIFFDRYVIKNHEYRYKIRYFDSEEYKYTEWSEKVTVNEGYQEDVSLSYNTEQAYFSFNDETYILQINGTIENPEIPNFTNRFSPMLLISNPQVNKTQAFPISGITDGTQIQLRGLLPVSFMDVPITILGIVPQENTYVDETKNQIQNSQEEDNESEDENSQNTEKVEEDKYSEIKEIHWLPLSTLKISGNSSKTVIIPSYEQSEGFDYSKKAF